MKKKKNATKQEMFSKIISKRDKAYKEGFYYQSIMLDYALIEDRLNEFLELQMKQIAV